MSSDLMSYSGLFLSFCEIFCNFTRLNLSEINNGF